jgi:hypothetical protein
VSAIAARPPALGAALARERAERSTALQAGVFFAIAAFAALQYGELVNHPPALRLLAVAAITSLGSAALSIPIPGRPEPAAAARVVALVATLVLALLALGVPAHLLAPAGWSRFGHHVGQGIDGLGAELWPYRGGRAWSRLAVLLVVPVALLLAGGLCFWPSRRAQQVRRASALSILIVLFVTGAANTPQDEPGLHGLVLLLLIAAWLWVPGATTTGAARAARWLILPALLALGLRPVLSSSTAWLGFREATAGAAGGSFQWDQVYGPIDWPRSEATMFTVTQSHPGLLRVTSLDRFDGLRFLRSAAPPGRATLDVARRRSPAWISHETVTVAGLRSRLLVAGDGLPLSLRWLSPRSPAITREADGTLATRSVPKSGVYTVTSYRPRPTGPELRGAPRGFPRTYLPYARFELPSREASGLSQPRFAAEAHTQAPADLSVGPQSPGRPLSSGAAARVEASPYGPMFRLARGLAAGAPSSYDVAARIQRYLLSNYRYDEHVPPARYPLEAFLFEQRRGYCQQFSGAMTLMLRMDGVPARVASGFKPDVYEPATGTWTIRAIDAHSWVEVFFTGIGWVPFDPTPPARQSSLPAAAGSSKNKSEILGTGTSGGAATARRAGGGGAASRGSTSGSGGPAGEEAGLAVAVLAALALAGLWLRAHLRLRRALAGEADGAVAELRRVLEATATTGRETTLAQLELRLRGGGRETAADYVAALSRCRYERTAAAPAPRGRTALRLALLRRRSLRTVVIVLTAMPPGGMRRRL